jgi:hypothetical protein
MGGGAIMILWGLRIIVRESTGVDAVKSGSGIASKIAEGAGAAAVAA